MRKEAPITENFVVYFYESCVGLTYKPLLDLPEIKPGASESEYESMSVY